MVKLQNSLWEDLRCVKHSKLPWCCIVFYLFQYRWRCNSKKFTEEYELYKAMCDIPHSYVACKTCLVKDRIVTPKPCKCFIRKFGLGYLDSLSFNVLRGKLSDVYFFRSKYGTIRKEAFNPPVY